MSSKHADQKRWAPRVSPFIGQWCVENKPDRKMDLVPTRVPNRLDAVDRGSDSRRGSADGFALVDNTTIQLTLQSNPTVYHGRLAGPNRIVWAAKDLRAKRQRAWVRRQVKAKSLAMPSSSQGSWRSTVRRRPMAGMKATAAPASVAAPSLPAAMLAAATTVPTTALVRDIDGKSRAAITGAQMLGWQVTHATDGRRGTVVGWCGQTGTFTVQFGPDVFEEGVAPSLLHPLPGQTRYTPPSRGWGCPARLA